MDYKQPPMLTATPTMKEINKIKKPFTGISFFSGCGGSSTGHKMGGINIVYANEFIKPARECYKLNHPKALVDGRDIREVDPRKIMKKLGIKRGDLDLLDGSPPCKSFSTAGAGSKNWGESHLYSDGVSQRTDDLFDEFVRMVDQFHPKVFVAENVPGLVHGKAKSYFVEIFKKLQNCGYAVSARVLDASQLGVAQARNRLIIVGVRNDLVKKGFIPSHPTALPTRTLTVRDLLPHIAKIKGKQQSILTYIPADVPSPTITASDGLTSETAAFSCGGFVETVKGERRKYKIAELKKISAFPDDYELTGKFEQRFERIGRAVPPLMMYHVTRHLVKTVLLPHAKGEKPPKPVAPVVAEKVKGKAKPKAEPKSKAEPTTKSEIKAAKAREYAARYIKEKTDKAKAYAVEKLKGVKKGKLQVRKCLLAAVKPHRKIQHAVLMSAGVDSHSVLFSMLELGMKPVCYSFTLDDRESRDFKIARATAKTFGLKFVPIYLPTDPEKIKAGLFAVMKTMKPEGYAAIECLYAFKMAIDAVKETRIGAGLGADLYFVLSKTGCMHFKDNADGYRLPKFKADQGPKSQLSKLKAYCESQGKTWFSPWQSKEMLREFVHNSWEEVNKPKQKNPVHEQYAEYMAKVKTYAHTNLQLGDSGISENFKQLLKDPDWNPNGSIKSMRGLFNLLMQGKIKPKKKAK